MLRSLHRNLTRISPKNYRFCTAKSPTHGQLEQTVYAYGDSFAILSLWLKEVSLYNLEKRDLYMKGMDTLLRNKVENFIIDISSDRIETFTELKDMRSNLNLILDDYKSVEMEGIMSSLPLNQETSKLIHSPLYKNLLRLLSAVKARLGDDHLFFLYIKPTLTNEELNITNITKNMELLFETINNSFGFTTLFSCSANANPGVSFEQWKQIYKQLDKSTTLSIDSDFIRYFLPQTSDGFSSEKLLKTTLKNIYEIEQTTRSITLNSFSGRTIRTLLPDVKLKEDEETLIAPAKLVDFLKVTNFQGILGFDCGDVYDDQSLQFLCDQLQTLIKSLLAQGYQKKSESQLVEYLRYKKTKKSDDENFTPVL